MKRSHKETAAAPQDRGNESGAIIKGKMDNFLELK